MPKPEGRVTSPCSRPEVVASYHEVQLALLLAHVDEAMDRFGAGELNPFEVDQELFGYSRATRELWKFCSIGNAVMTARMIQEMAPIDWWERGAFRRRT